MAKKQIKNPWDLISTGKRIKNPPSKKKVVPRNIKEIVFKFDDGYTVTTQDPYTRWEVCYDSLPIASYNYHELNSQKEVERTVTVARARRCFEKCIEELKAKGILKD